MTGQTLAQELDALAKYGAIKKELPHFIREGINPNIELRPYQIDALSRFFFYINDYAEKAKPTHLLFHMATGSGKTVLMACSILYLYTLGYRNFLFFVNSKNIIEKTKSNFLNKSSIKYLFNQSIKLENKEVQIVEQDNFQHIIIDDINIVFTTIQGLHSNLTTPKENSLTFEDFEEKKIVLISDEAHHINSMTKKLGAVQLDVEGTWENTVQRIFNSNKDNILLEYTATVDLEHIRIKEKYDPKIIYQYTLREFREDKYSKDVNVLESDTDNLKRALQAIVLSQYRLKVAQENKIHLKPVILFKSKTIKDSKEFESSFHEYISSLRILELESIASKSVGVIKKAFVYFEKNGISYENLIAEIKEDFSITKCVSVNSQEESEEKQILVNTLEAPENEIRAVFAVDKLNEGWDVLNLFDIVRLYDTRDSKGSVIGKTTMAEAQLIGRGARYFPFHLNVSQEKYKRKYDEDLDNDLRILEELYYHSSYNPRYIYELQQALKETGIKAKEEKTIELKLKESFKNSSFWKHGIIYVNEKYENKNEDKKNLFDYKIDTVYKYDLDTGFNRETRIFEFSLQGSPSKDTKRYKLKDLGKNVIEKAIDKIDFFHHSNLCKYIPPYTGRNELLDWTKNINLEITGSSDVVENLTQEEKLEIALFVFNNLKSKILSESKEFIGTKVFKAHNIHKIFADKVLKVDIDENSDKQTGVSMSKNTNPEFQLDLFAEDWYAYEDDFGTSEEKYLVKFVNTALENLSNKYEDIYLVRNAKAFQIFDFNDGKAFEPDYVLFLKEKTSGNKMYYQVFIEPKGEHLLKTDSWKQDLLKRISSESQIETIHSDRKYSLIGMPFYNEVATKLEFIEEFESRL